jgi:hypothetical protein
MQVSQHENVGAFRRIKLRTIDKEQNTQIGQQIQQMKRRLPDALQSRLEMRDHDRIQRIELKLTRHFPETKRTINEQRH